MQTPEPEKRGGRKPSYTSEQLAAAIDAVRGEGLEPTPAFVSKALSALFDISGTVRGETLAREIQAHVEAEGTCRTATRSYSTPSAGRRTSLRSQCRSGLGEKRLFAWSPRARFRWDKLCHRDSCLDLIKR